jgi:hypothetical protein
MMKNLKKYLIGGDLRSIGAVEKIVPLIKNQKIFDELFKHMFSEDRLIVMRAADATEKITIKNPIYLTKHKSSLLKLFETARDKELKWHLATLISRIELSAEELKRISARLFKWAKDKSESKIVRVNSLQSLYYLSHQHKEIREDYKKIIKVIEKENIPSLSARIKKITK